MAEKEPTHALVPLPLWQQIQQYIQAAPTGSIPLQQAALMMNEMQKVGGVFHNPGGEPDQEGEKDDEAPTGDDKNT